MSDLPHIPTSDLSIREISLNEHILVETEARKKELFPLSRRSSNGQECEELRQLIELRKPFWKERVSFPKKLEPNYLLSPCGLWVLEYCWRPADMCALEERLLFHLPTMRELRGKDTKPWITLDPPTDPFYSPPATGETSPHHSKQQQDILDDPTKLVQYTTDGMQLSMNIGCHDTYFGDEPEPDYISGAAFFSFESVALDPISEYRTTFLRVTTYHNTWDPHGRHWIYPLPTFGNFVKSARSI